MEVHGHSIFSKWFSESGKLVARLFAKIMELVSYIPFPSKKERAHSRFTQTRKVTRPFPLGKNERIAVLPRFTSLPCPFPSPLACELSSWEERACLPTFGFGFSKSGR